MRQILCNKCGKAISPPLYKVDIVREDYDGKCASASKFQPIYKTKDFCADCIDDIAKMLNEDFVRPEKVYLLKKAKPQETVEAEVKEDGKGEYVELDKPEVHIDNPDENVDSVKPKVDDVKPKVEKKTRGEMILEARKRRANGETLGQIGKALGVAPSTVCRWLS